MIDKEIVALYVRVSTQEQAREGYSIEEQKDKLIKYAEVHGWIIYNTYVDAGYSGGSLERPSIKRLLDDADGNKFTKVVVYKLDRISRSQKGVVITLTITTYIRNTWRLIVSFFYIKKIFSKNRKKLLTSYIYGCIV